MSLKCLSFRIFCLLDPLSVGVSYDALLWMNRSLETCHLHSEENGQWRDQVLRSSERPFVDATLYCYTNRCNLLLRSKSGENILILIIYLICQFLVSLTVYTIAHVILDLGDLYTYNIIRPIAHVLCSLCLDTNHNSDLSCGPCLTLFQMSLNISANCAEINGHIGIWSTLDCG